MSPSKLNNWKVKKIVVEVGASLSLQLHKQRSEHWVVVKGSALVEINERKFQKALQVIERIAAMGVTNTEELPYYKIN